jgi:glycosyltransferase involved in cell wall biosynthesis
MKIALVTRALNVGGLETFLFALARQLRGRGHEVQFLLTEQIGAWHERPVAEGFRVNAILPDQQGKKVHVEEIGGFLAGFDVAILNHSLAAQSSLGLLPAGTVTLSVLHNNNEEIFRVGLANMQNLDMAVAVSDGVFAGALNAGVVADRVVCIRNGIEVLTEYPKRDHTFFCDEPLKAVFLGRVDHLQKGVFYLPGIIAKVSAAGVPLTFDIVGGGDKDFTGLQRRLAVFADRIPIIFHGALSHEEAMRILQRADVMLMPSHFEGQPITLFEGMARGVVPIVSSLKGITDNVVTSWQNGVLVPVGDEAAFAEAVKVLAGDRAMLRTLSQTAWRTIVEEHSVEGMVDRYLTLIAECREKRRNGLLPVRSGAADESLLMKEGFLAFLRRRFTKMAGKIIPQTIC